jgi:hypothetical protein
VVAVTVRGSLSKETPVIETSCASRTDGSVGVKRNEVLSHAQERPRRPWAYGGPVASVLRFSTRQRRVPWAARASLPALRRAAIACLLLLLVPSAADALPPRPPSAAKTRDAIRQLTLAAPLSMRGYDRDLFPHWISQGGGCDSRDRVLIRDARDVNVSSDCRITSGAWRSFYDGLTFTDSSQVDIDHVVPLANAWRSGAKRWPRERRRAFANTLRTQSSLPSARRQTARRATKARSRGSRPGARHGACTRAGGFRSSAPGDSRLFAPSGRNYGRWWRPADADMRPRCTRQFPTRLRGSAWLPSSASRPDDLTRAAGWRDRA